MKINKKAKRWLHIAKIFRQRERDLKKPIPPGRFELESVPEDLLTDETFAFIQSRLDKTSTWQGCRRIDIEATYQAILACPEAEEGILSIKEYVDELGRRKALFEHAEQYTKAIEKAAREEILLVQQQDTHKGSGLGRLLLAVSGLFVLAFAVVGFFVFQQWSKMKDYVRKPLGSSSAKIKVVIPRGSNLEQSTKILLEKNVVKGTRQFYMLARYYPYFRKVIKSLPNQKIQIRSGEYLIPQNITPLALLAMLRKGAQKKSIRVTIPEGFDIWKISARLLKKGIIQDKQKFIRLAQDGEAATKDVGWSTPSYEGYLYPDTYRFNKNTSEKVVIQRMVQQFKAVYGSKMREKAKDFQLTHHQIVTLAAIIERETGQKGERPLVASVFHNRMKRRWKMESCATVIYGLLPNFNGNLTYKDLENPHEYNTYKHKGLPPGPIANPGKKALWAALNPKKSCYMFFVSKNNGTHVFSCTKKEHNHWVDIYQKKGKGLQYNY